MKTVPVNGDLAWAIVAYNINHKHCFESVTGIVYEARVEGNTIYYKGSDRNNGEDEDISKVDFCIAFEKIKDLPEINTNTIKDVIDSSVYRKRSPLIGMLYSFKIIM